MEVLVTGGAGFIGSNLVRRLLDEGHAVRVLDDGSTGDTANLEGLNVDLQIGSVADPDDARIAIDGIEVVFHLAALPSVVRSIASPLPTHHVNATGVLTMLMASQQAGVRRFVYASSSSVYGNSTELPKREDMPTSPISPYGVSKLTGEEYCRVVTGVYGLETLSLRYFNVFGPWQNPVGGYAGVVPKFITAALDGQPPTILGTGSQTRDFTYVDNAVDANIRAAIAPGAGNGEAVNIACGRHVSVLDLWRNIVGLTAADPGHLSGPARPGDISGSLADISKAERMLGYRPVVDLKEGLARTVAWLAGNRAPTADDLG